MYPSRLTLSQQQVPLISILFVLQPSLFLLHFIVKDFLKPSSDSFLYSKENTKISTHIMFTKEDVNIYLARLSFVNIQLKFRKYKGSFQNR